MKDIRTVLVVGTGIMGRGIAERLSERGIETILLGRSDTSLAAAQESIEASRSMAVRRKRIDAKTAEAAAGRLTYTLDDAEAGRCDLLIESVTEDLAVKRDVLGSLMPQLSPDALAATNTSALRVGAIAEGLADSDRIFGFHFMNPAATVDFSELVFPQEFAEESRDRVRGLTKALKLQTIECADHEGFVVNRLLMLLLNETARLVEEGVATPQQIDKAMRLACGHPMGPVAMADFIGLDTVRSELLTLRSAHGDAYAPAQVLTQLVDTGHLGRKTKSGLLQSGKILRETP